MVAVSHDIGRRVAGHGQAGEVKHGVGLILAGIGDRASHAVGLGQPGLRVCLKVGPLHVDLHTELTPCQRDRVTHRVEVVVAGIEAVDLRAAAT